MIYAIRDKKYHFVSLFDTKRGTYVRTGILDDENHDTGVDLFMASFPHLIDVGIMGHCIHGKTGLCAKAGVQCYQSGMYIADRNMPLEDFEWIARQCKHRTHQFALGGRGDPDQHENFKEILKIARKNNIVPNFTTSGYGMTPQIASLCNQYCGAVAVSWYRSKYTVDAINMLIKAGVKTNIHYVLGKNTIDEAIKMLETDDMPQGINAVVFLLHKPAGQGTVENMLSADDEKTEKFFEVFQKKHKCKIGVDSCTVPGIIQFCDKVLMESIDTCEGARYSCYIGSDMKMTPCSFDRSNKYAVQLRPVTIMGAWNSQKFDEFRNILKTSCPECENKYECMGGCPLMKNCVLCTKENRSF